MADLIDRQAAIDAVHYEWDLCLNFDGSGTEIANDTEKALCDVPSADIDLSDFSDKLWAAAYERGKAEAVRHDVTDTNVGDMISRQAAIDAVRSYYDEFDEREESIEERIEQLPSAQPERCEDCVNFSKTRLLIPQSAEAVRCKDCKHSYETFAGLICSHGVCVDCVVRDDFYCSYGERNNDGFN